MPLQPKKTKYRKMMKGRTNGLDYRGTEVSFGSFGLKAMEAKWITSAQIEAVKKSVGRLFKKKGRLWIRIFPAKPITEKGAETPMGGGKGAVSHYVFPTRPGRILFEVDGVDEKTARIVFKKASDKLPLRTKFVKKQDL
jgi:large subunit ribosomal protein L16